MIRIRIEFLSKKEQESILQLLATTYDIIEKSNVMPSKNPNCKYKLQHLVLMKKENING